MVFMVPNRDDDAMIFMIFMIIIIIIIIISIII